MNLNLADKVYIVTGGASGIGEAICRVIAEEGGIVIIADRNADTGRRLCEELSGQSYKVLAIPAELTDEEAIRSLIQSVADTYKRIDGLVNNAGTNDNISLENGSVHGFRQSLSTNLVHYYAMAHYALPHLKESKGAIVNIGSKVSVTGQGGTSGYAASKGGINALTREWAVELLPYDIRVNAVIPAEVDTPQYASWLKAQADSEQKLKRITSNIPFQNRFTKPGEIAGTVAFLLSDVSSHTTGADCFCGWRIYAS